MIGLVTALALAAAPPVPQQHPSWKIVDDKGNVLLARKDVVLYDWKQHRLLLRKGVRQALERRLEEKLVKGVPFVVMVANKPCYKGVLTSSLSGRTFSGVVIDLKPIEGPENEIELALGYPDSSHFRGTDPRGDARVRKALADKLCPLPRK
jgi:hypothetical protein